MRIYGNRQLKTLPGQATRPTPSRVREALFNIWHEDVEGCRWLDLCAGSGAMGAEALCRGAAIAVGIEQSNRACAIIQHNWQQVARPEQTFQIVRGDVIKKLPTLEGQQFDRIYFDPPYAGELYEPVLRAIAYHRLLAIDGEMAVEYSPGHLREETFETFSKTIPQLQLHRNKVYGNTALAFYKLADS